MKNLFIVFFSLLEEVVDSTYDVVYLFFDHRFAEYEEDILYGAPKAERELCGLYFL
jgi:hypothetical protein